MAAFVLIFFLLISQPVAAVEQLLSAEPIFGDVAGLAADQVVRHGALLLLRDLLGSFTVSEPNNGYNCLSSSPRFEACPPPAFAPPPLLSSSVQPRAAVNNLKPVPGSAWKYV